MTSFTLAEIGTTLTNTGNALDADSTSPAYSAAVPGAFTVTTAVPEPAAVVAVSGAVAIAQASRELRPRQRLMWAAEGDVLGLVARAVVWHRARCDAHRSI